MFKVDNYVPNVDIMDLTLRSRFLRDGAQGSDLNLNDAVQSRVQKFALYNPSKFIII